MPDPPAGTVTFLLTDIEGSTRRWEAFPVTMRDALQRDDAFRREAIDGGAALTPFGPRPRLSRVHDQRREHVFVHTPVEEIHFALNGS